MILPWWADTSLPNGVQTKSIIQSKLKVFAVIRDHWLLPKGPPRKVLTPVSSAYLLQNRLLGSEWRAPVQTSHTERDIMILPKIKVIHIEWAICNERLALHGIGIASSPCRSLTQSEQSVPACVARVPLSAASHRYLSRPPIKQKIPSDKLTCIRILPTLHIYYLLNYNRVMNRTSALDASWCKTFAFCDEGLLPFNKRVFNSCLFNMII